MFKNKKDLARHIQKDYENSEIKGKKSFRRAVDKPKYQGLPPGTAATILKHFKKGTIYVPRKWAIIYGINLTAPAPVCPKCHVVHLRKTCPKPRAQPKDLFGYSVKDLREAIENRVEW